jgi:phosphoglycolate phosphatase
MPRLVLFDIDGTLIRDAGVARSSFAEALVTVYGFDGSVDRFDFSGRTDPQIAHMILADAGLEHAVIERRLPELWEVYLQGLSAGANRESIFALPGVEPLLDALATRDDCVLGLLTGNIEPGARIKLGPPDLNRHFTFGAFGSDSRHREELPPIAVERAQAATGRSFTPRDVVIIGDSIYDVRCGVPHDATTIAVASGKTSADRLIAENPTHFFPSLQDTDRVVDAIFSTN